MTGRHSDMASPEGRRNQAEAARGPLRFPGDPGALPSVFEQAPAGLCAFDGPEHVLVAVNRAAREVLGERAELGRPARELIAPAAGKRFVAVLDEAYRNARPVRYRRLCLVAQDPAPRNLVLGVTVTPRRTSDGVLVGLTCHLDVTSDPATSEPATVEPATFEPATFQPVTEPVESAVTAMQRCLLPEYLPVLPGVRTAAFYRPANDPGAAGGDWFDAVPLGDRRIAVLVGDVPGHGTRACALMGQLRSVFSAALLDGRALSEALAHLDRFVAYVPAAAGTTLCVAVHDPATGDLTYATCGHCPPLVLSASGTASYLPGSGGVPLGMPGGIPLVRSARLETHDAVILHTDGLVKHPDAPLSDGLRRLHAEATRLAPGLASGELADPVHQLCCGLVECVADAGALDDISIIALQRLDRISPDYREQLTCGPGVPGEVRLGLGRWLDGIGADAQDVRDVQLAVGEAVVNVIEHAYPDGPGPVRVEASHDLSGRVFLTVSDQGRWLTPVVEPDLRGRGLRLIRACMDSVEIDSSGSGTTLLLDRVLRRAPIRDVVTEARSLVPRGRAEPEFSASIRRSARPCLVVGGPVDAGTIHRFRAAIQDGGRGGTLPLDLDLSAVSYLGSVGVRTLHELAEQMAVDSRALRFVAPPDSPARYLLDLTGLTDLVVSRLAESAPATHGEVGR